MMQKTSKKVFLVILVILLLPEISLCADLSTLEREALAMRVELTRIGSSGDPFERESILKKIIDNCAGTEEAEAAYWDLADLYLDGFSEEKREDAKRTLEMFLDKYPGSRWATQVKIRLLDLYDIKDSRRAQLKNQVLQDKSLPSILRMSIN